MRNVAAGAVLVIAVVVGGAGCGGGGTTCAKTQCGAECVDTDSDARNCGACGMACAAGNVCVAGKCSLTCAAGTAVCGVTCANLNNDPSNCGACGTSCSGGTVCSVGKCAVSCPMGQMNCTGSCVNTNTDQANCGACAMACPLGNVCVMGKCTVACAPGQDQCGGACVNLKSDQANCGSCGNACPMGNVCAAGMCGVSCPMGQTNCSGSCVNLDADPNNCGLCGAVCPQGQSCGKGMCGVSCPQGQTACNGSCVSLMADAGNCGACGKSCIPGQSCINGSCALVCPMGFAVCGTCVNLMVDNANCGGCGKVCAMGFVCSGGACVASCSAPMIQCNNKMSCVDPRFDTSNCGGCGLACGVPANGVAACVNSSCILGPCSAGFFNCDGNDKNGCEVNGATDLNNCGGCNRACTPQNGLGSCGNGVCSIVSCTMGFADCDMKVGTGCEVNTTNNPANCSKCGMACPAPANATASCVAGACGIVCKAGFGDCNGNPGDGCETNLTNNNANCGVCGSNCGTGMCVNSACSQSIHNSINFVPVSAAANTCSYNGIGAVKYTNLGAMTWKQCMVEASKRSAMLCASNYTVPLGWYAHRVGANAMTGVWNVYQAAAIGSAVACVVGRDPIAVYDPSKILASNIVYDSQTWHYQDFGSKFYDECQALATQYGASIITPWTIGLNLDNYWVQSVHMCNTYEWITGGGVVFGIDNLGGGARSSQHSCMVGFVDN